MIVKMKFLSITGPRTDIDRVCEVYLSKYEMQLENAVTELKTTDNLLPFAEVNPYKEPLAKAEQFSGLLSDKKFQVDHTMDQDHILKLIRDINHDYLELVEKKELLKKKRDNLVEEENVLEPFRPLEVDLCKVLKYQYMKVRFGRIGLDYYRRLERYMFENLNAIFLEGTRNENYVYGCYIAANADIGKVDAIFRSLHFERISFLNDYIGTPAEACERLLEEIEETKEAIKDVDKDIEELVDGHGSQILGAKIKLEKMSNNFDVRKKAARLDNEQSESYLLCGWMGEEDVEAFLKETEHDDRVFVMVEENREKYFGEPPTKLKNPKFFKPFEMFIRMYGLPSHNEMDPTIFVALTYTFIFGAMFGDVGQGLCLFVGGGLLYLTKKMNLAGIISIAGLFSTFFGFMFGSIFGFEDIIEARWLRPVEAMTNLPFIGQLNTVFVVAIAFGMGLNILVMLFNIANAAKAHDLENMLFSHNGLAGLVFYGFLVLTIVLYMTGHKTPGNVLMVIFLGIPVLLFVFKEPLGNLVQKRKKKMEEGKVMFFVQAFFELFETMLSYFSNTISYVRIGAFAVSHAAMMEVVLMLFGVQDGNPNLIAMVLGNILVCGLEGLVVGIQVLRLEYYEMFSRFYHGTGREFIPFNKENKN